MTVETLQRIAASNEWLALFPELFLAGTALVLLVMEIVLPRREHRQIPVAAMMAPQSMLAGSSSWKTVRSSTAKASIS